MVVSWVFLSKNLIMAIIIKYTLFFFNVESLFKQVLLNNLSLILSLNTVDFILFNKSYAFVILLMKSFGVMKQGADLIIFTQENMT